MGLPNAFSIDVEDWVNSTVLDLAGVEMPPGRDVVSNCELLLELLAGADAKSTWFFLGDVAEEFPGLVRRIAEAGHELGIHGFHHQNVDELGKERFRSAVRRAKAAVEDASGQVVLGHRAPNFSIGEQTPWALEVLIEEGFRYDSSLFAFRTRRYGSFSIEPGPHWIETSSGPIYEIPVTVGSLGALRIPAAGGGYFLRFPLAYTRMVLESAHRSGRFGVFYLHPCEVQPDAELRGLPEDLPRDTEQAIRQRHKRFWRRRDPGGQKLKRLLARFSFDTMREVFGLDGLAKGD